MTKDMMVEWHHHLDGTEFEQALEVGDGQGSLICCSPWGCKKSDTTEGLTELKRVNPKSSHHRGKNSFSFILYLQEIIDVIIS